MRTIAIMNNKGGVGKTVTAITLAEILTRDHKKNVVLVDCDGQMNLTRFYLPSFDAEDAPTVYDILTAQGEPVWFDNLTPAPGNPNLELLPAATGLYTLDVNSMLAEGGRALFKRLRDFQECIEEDCGTDFLLFDCPPGYSAAACAALMAAHEVIIPMLVDGFSFAGMADMAAQISSMKQVNPKIRITGVLITQWRRSEVVREGEAFLRGLPVPVFRQTIARTDKLVETTFTRTPITQHSSRSAAARNYRSWVQELLREED